MPPVTHEIAELPATVEFVMPQVAPCGCTIWACFGGVQRLGGFNDFVFKLILLCRPGNAISILPALRPTFASAQGRERGFALVQKLTPRLV